MLRFLVLLLGMAAAAQAQAPAAPSKQNPSPMTETVRLHQRIPQTEVQGRRWTLSIGTLLLPATARMRTTIPLYIHFHGASWLAEWSVGQADRHAAVLSVQLGSGSGVYAAPFRDPGKFGALLDEAAKAISPDHPVHFHPIVLSGWSAGYGAIREILRNHDNWERVDGVLLLDGIHTSYVPDGQPGPLDEANLAPFLDFAREAVSGRKRFVITHSEIFPGTFASTTECTEYLLRSLGVRARPVLKWGPVGMQQISDARAGKFRVLGFAGNTAPDHVDHMHGMKEFLRAVE